MRARRLIRISEITPSMQDLCGASAFGFPGTFAARRATQRSCAISSPHERSAAEARGWPASVGASTSARFKTLNRVSVWSADRSRSGLTEWPAHVLTTRTCTSRVRAYAGAPARMLHITISPLPQGAG